MNTLKTGVLMGFLFGLFMLVGQLLGGASGLVIGFVFALGTNFFAYWFSDKMALRMSGAVPVDEARAPGLHDMVRRLSARAGLPMPRVYVIPSAQPNAFATGRNPSHAAVAVTEGLLGRLSEEELEGVVAHELAHIKHRDILIASVAATIAGAVSMIAQMAQYRAMFGGLSRDDEESGANPFVMLLGLLFAPLAAGLIQMAISRSREFEADKGGAEICGRPLALASALKKIEAMAERMPVDVNPSSAHLFIVNPLGGDRLRAMANLFRTHPLTEQRVARLQALAAGGVS